MFAKKGECEVKGSKRAKEHMIVRAHAMSRNLPSLQSDDSRVRQKDESRSLSADDQRRARRVSYDLGKVRVS